VLWLMAQNDPVKKAVAGYFNDPRGTANLLGTTMAGNGVEVVQNDENAKRLAELKQKLEEEIKAKKELEKLSKQIEITITPEGLRIELIEDRNGTFYQSGSAQLSASGQELLVLLAAELKTLPNQLLIEGHTDAAQYSTDANYSNWELSADRANSARRLLQQDGVRRDQVTQVRGFADQMLRVQSNPYDPSNRRITILVKNQDNAQPPELAHAAIVDGDSSGAVPGEGALPTAPKTQSRPATPSASPARPAPAPTSAPAKPLAGQPAEKPEITGKLTSMPPGSKK